MKAPRRIRRLLTLRTLLLLAAGLLGAKVLTAIVAEYVNYFPANFDAAFLIGREETFSGIYPPAFYIHIIAGPLNVLLAAYLLFSGKRKSHHGLHRRLGQIQVAAILFALVPSGLIMSAWAFSGPIAGVGFALQSIATGLTAAIAAGAAMRRKLAQHQVWATRCFLLLISPLLFRLVSGLLIVTDRESLTAYRVNAWASWIVPLLVYEVWRIVRNLRRAATIPRSYSMEPIVRAMPQANEFPLNSHPIRNER